MRYISIRQILDDILADSMMTGITLERAVNYAVEFMQIIGIPNEFEDKVANVTIENYRGILPCDFLEMTQVKKCNNLALRYSLSSFKDNNPYTYKIQGNVIFTSTKDETLTIAYKAIKLDEDGFPLIPDNGTFARALELYIQKRWFTALFNSGKINQAVLKNVQQEYAWAVGAASSDLLRPSLDQMESFKNMWCSLIPKMYNHASTFSTQGNPEKLNF